nr:unnamed protein product [Callosobruchus chinensis]
MLLECSKVHLRFYQYMATLAANFAIINSELHYGWPSPFIPVLEGGNYTVTISSETGSLLTVTHPIGSMFGAIIICRKKLVVLSSIPAIANWLVLGLAAAPSVFFMGRFMSGFLDGISFTVVPMYVGEISEPQIRGLLSSAIPTTTVIGFLIINSLGLFTIQQFSGRSVIIFYCRTIFDQSHTVISSETATIIYFAVMLFFSAVTSIVVDFFGRRPLLILSVSATAMALLTNAVYLYLTNCTEVDISQLSFMPIVALIGFVVTFSMGLQTIPHLIMGEIFATGVKAFALCLMDIYNSVVETVSSKYFHWTNDTWGLHVPFFSFFLCCILGLFFVIFYVPETKGKTLEAIQDDLRERQRLPGSKKSSTVDKPRLSHD